MFYWVVVFSVMALISGIFGFGGIASASVGIAQVIFFIFVAFIAITVLAGLIRRMN